MLPGENQKMEQLLLGLIRRMNQTNWKNLTTRKRWTIGSTTNDRDNFLRFCYPCEVIAEAWLSPQLNQYPHFRGWNGIAFWRWLAMSTPKDDHFTLISLAGLTQDILKALLIHYDIKIQCLYDMLFIDGFSANLHPPSANVFSLCFDFLRQVPLGTERNYHIQTFPELENYRRHHVLSWKWDPFSLEHKESDQGFDICRAAIWIRRDLETGKKTAIFYNQPKRSKYIPRKCQTQWRMSQFCDDINNRARSRKPEDIDQEDSEDIFHFLHRYFKYTFKWTRVLELNQRKVRALEEEAFTSPMIETTRDIYRQQSALDTHLSILNLQKTMITALCSREVRDDMFWPKDARLLFGDIEDTLGEKILDFERMRKQCDDIQNLIFNTIAIEESRAAVDQGRSIGRLTWMTFVFLPLSFVASILGMNVYQLERTSLWLYFAVSIPLLAFIILLLVLLKAGILYSQSGETDLNFFRWVLAGRPRKQRLARLDLEKGGLTDKLKDRLGGTGRAPKDKLPAEKGKGKGNDRGKKQE
ncbi:unnamed protein product [Tuber melanosporum]|uniref:(Perigord truffle) hypothetical protein n=1 Tax=Tuber melanosporum (strain Mel28) TaxID=656061 RepID=D5GHT8_TUBMM|nr:uncharacterized protein GSTUM_00008097001 [Tuber melanosporum]CAZ84081.1 unnamed protein product [Tuber melanosporum]